jgi:hypothetical protein
MTRLSIALAVASLTAFAFTTPTFAQEFSNPAQATPTTVGSSDFNQGAEQKVSTYRKIASEVALLRYRTALKLTAAQERYWPAAASALRALSRQNELNEAVVKRYAPAVKPLIASLNDEQRQVAMGLAAQAGLAQYAALF